MAALDKFLLAERLERLGWKNVSEHGYRMVPPDSLWVQRPATFDLEAAQHVQSLLEPEKPTTLDEKIIRVLQQHAYAEQAHEKP
jgi:hypothetical protein